MEIPAGVLLNGYRDRVRRVLVFKTHPSPLKKVIQVIQYPAILQFNHHPH
jgi:hypothetical protein